MNRELAVSKISDADTATAIVGDVVTLYEIMFSEPPYNERPSDPVGFRNGYLGHTRRPGFTLLGARTPDQRLIGMAYGIAFPGREATWWSPPATGRPPELGFHDVYAVMQWVVHPKYRSTGLGRRLFHALLACRPEPYATLASYPRSLARALYDRWGWRPIGRVGPMDLLLLPRGGSPGDHLRAVDDD